MTALILRVVVYIAIAWFIYSSARRIWRDLAGPRLRPRAAPRPEAAAKGQAPDVIELKRGSDGVFRSSGDSDRRP